MHHKYFFQKYERRARHVTDSEMNLWENITPNMMSDEEEVNGEFKIHRPGWRSSDFNGFLERLDARATLANSKRPRYDRCIGTPIKVDPPQDAEPWMVNTPEENN